LQEAGTSIERQGLMIRAVAAEYEAEIDESYALSDKGVSGFRGDNVKKKLGLFIRLCKEGIVRRGDILCIERVNRLSRMIWTEQVKLWEEILSYGVVIVTCEPRCEYTSKSIGRLDQGCPLAVFMMLGHQSSEEKSQWITFAHKLAREKAMKDGTPHGQSCPRWLRPMGRPHPNNPRRRITESWAERPERVKVIKMLHRWTWDLSEDGEGLGASQIVDKLRAQGVRYWSRSGKWTPSIVYGLLKSRALIGFCVPDRRNFDPRAGRVAYKNYPAVLTEEEYERTQRALAKRRSKRGRKNSAEFNLFTGLMRTLNGEPMYRRYSMGPNGERYPVMAPAPQTLRAPYTLLEDVFLGSLRQLKPADVDGTLKPDEWSERTLVLQAKSGELRSALDAIDRQLAELPPDEWPERAVARMAALEKEIKRVDKELSRAKLYGSTSARVETLADTQSILDYLHGLTDPAERRATLERIKARLPVLVEQITIATDGECGRSKWVHVRVAYKGGHVDRYSLRIGTPNPPLKRFCGDW